MEAPQRAVMPTGCEVNPCTHCGPADEQRTGFICTPCFDIAWDIVVANRRRFQKLLDAGVSRRMANEIMIARIDGTRSS